MNCLLTVCANRFFLTPWLPKSAPGSVQVEIEDDPLLPLPGVWI